MARSVSVQRPHNAVIEAIFYADLPLSSFFYDFKVISFFHKTDKEEG